MNLADKNKTTKPLSPQALRDRLLSKIKKKASDQINFDRLQKKLAFEFLLRRVSFNKPDEFLLKGGYALELKLNVGRTTRDLDLIIRSILRASVSQKFEELAPILKKKLVEALADPVNDEEDKLISFLVGEGTREIKGGGGGARFEVKMQIGGQAFAEFHVDLAFSDLQDIPEEKVNGSVGKWLFDIDDGNKINFPPDWTITTAANELHFAEKFHAYTRPREGGTTRTKEFADMVLLMQHGLDIHLVKDLIHRVFEYWKTHTVPSDIKDVKVPPKEWAVRYKEFAEEVGIEEDLDNAWGQLGKFLRELL